ncbi:hypothetical protein [Chlorogloeopsis fritschii]|uniref:hypothetical protein n=1 Tax=Chlorogloeopsis fritschii TaxID=1124 RepID=UPI0023F17487|nr:hypothetical protein [Chlorogloeopsis fritschii]
MTRNWVESGKIMEGALNPSQILQPPPVPSTGSGVPPPPNVGDRWGTPRRYLLRCLFWKNELAYCTPKECFDKQITLKLETHYML